MDDDLEALAANARRLTDDLAQLEREAKAKSELRRGMLIAMARKMSFREIAAAVGITPGRVNQILGITRPYTPERTP